MIKLGITGGIASGKSLVTNIFSILGYPVYYTDDRAKVLMLESEAIRKDLIDLLGPEVYIGNALNKQKIADYLFADPQQAQRINSIVHPRVKEDFIKWCAVHKNSSLVIMECAILIEANFLDAVDQSLLVYAPLETRIERVKKRDNITHEQALKRISAQLSEQEKIKKVDFLIENDGEALLLPQVYSLLKELGCCSK